MQIIVVVGLIIVKGLLWLSPSIALSAPWWALAGAACAYVLLAGALARAAAVSGLRRLMRTGQGPGRRTAALMLLAQAYLLAGLVGLMLLGWGTLISGRLGLGLVPLVDKLVVVIPFVAGLVAYWWMIYPLDRAMRMNLRREAALMGRPIPATWTRGQFLAFNLRHHFLFIAVPVGAIILVLDTAMLLVDRVPQAVLAACSLALAGAVFVAAPAAIVRIWRTRPLPDGPLRDRLEEMRRLMGLRCRGMRVWDTGGVIVNAGVLGLVGRIRYVLLTDALLEQLDGEAVEAIFAHEAAHVRYRHIPYMLLFTVGVLRLGMAGGNLLTSRTRLPAEWAEMFVLSGVLAVWVVLFGMLSRRLERQADVFAAAAVGAEKGAGPMDGPLTGEGAGAFARALTLVGQLNGIAPTKWNFRHGSMRDRLGFLEGLMRSGKGLPAAERSIRRIKVAIWAAFVAGVLVAAWGV